MITIFERKGMKTEIKEELSYNHVQFVESENGKVTNRYSVHLENMKTIMEHFGYEVNEIEYWIRSIRRTSNKRVWRVGTMSRKWL